MIDPQALFPSLYLLVVTDDITLDTGCVAMGTFILCLGSGDKKVFIRNYMGDLQPCITGRYTFSAVKGLNTAVTACVTYTWL